MKSLSGGARWMPSAAACAAWMAAGPRRGPSGGGAARPSDSTRSRMARSTSAPGSASSTWRRKRSSCASGSGKVPSCSIEFWVATTMKGSGRGRVIAAGGDLPLGHGLEERRLHLGRGAVDLVDQHERVEERAGDEVEAPVVGAEHLGAGHVGRHEVGRALDAREARVEAGGERLDGAGLGEARRPLDQDVPAGEDADGEPLDQPLVADEPRRDGFGEACDGLEGIGDALLVERHAVLLIDPGRDWHGSGAGATRGDSDFRLTWAGRAKVRRGMVAIEVCRVGANTGEHRQWRPFCEHLLKRGSTGNVYGSLAPVKFSIS